MTYRKKLIEVALPLVAINAASARENYIYRGNPSGIHKWWAQRPLAACRAVLFGSLVNDPDDDPMYGVSNDVAASERAKLFNLIEELVKWENSNNPDVINRARAEIARSIAANNVADGKWTNEQVVVPPLPPGEGRGEGGADAHVAKVGATAHDFKHKLAAPAHVNAFLVEHAPPVLDPFAGGGSIPLEAQRLGLRAFASDLNPVAVLINKALIEIPPKFAGRPPVNPESRGKTSGVNGKPKKQKKLVEKEWHGAAGLAEDVRYYGRWMRDEAEKRIGHLYPTVKVTEEMAKDRLDLQRYVGEERTVIAWLWARTVASPNPAVSNAHVPLIRSFVLSSKKGRRVWLDPVIDVAEHSYKFIVRSGDGDAGIGTVNRAGARCLLTGTTIPLDYVRAEGRAGRIKYRLLAVVAEGLRGRIYLPPDDMHANIASGAAVPNNVPESELPAKALGFRVQNYGMTKHRDLFTSRQLAILGTLCSCAQEIRGLLQSSDPQCGLDYANSLTTYLAFAVSKCVPYGNSLVPWYTAEDRPSWIFGRQTVSMVWDFAEVNPLTTIGGSFEKAVEIIADILENLPRDVKSGVVSQQNATTYHSDVPSLISTDPPYYDNVPYADLSDLMYVWIRESLKSTYPQLLSTMLVPKGEELIADPFRHNGRQAAAAFFEDGIRQVFGRMRESCNHEFPTTVYYAFKQAESTDDSDEGESAQGSWTSTGWETFLDGLARTGWQVDGTWPLRTERSGRLRDNLSNSLASSIVLVCRPRAPGAPLATRKEFITTLRNELPEALRNLQHGNIAPVDLAQAAIGPGMAVFTRYAKVMESDGQPMTVRTALGLINHALDEVLAEQEGEFDGDTRWALAWFEQFGMDEGPFGDAETLSKAKNTAVNGLVEAGVVVARAGKVRLVRRDELPDDWDPASDRRLTVWEVTQHLIRTLDAQGESGAATLMHKLGGIAETARDLAYRLYNLCERKKWAEEALAYNGLVIAWPELTKLALAERNRPAEKQKELL